MKKFIMEFTILILTSVSSILYGQGLLIEPEDESGELYIKTLNMPNELTTDVSFTLVGMSFSGGRDDNKIYSHYYTNRYGVTQSITGESKSIDPNGTWAIEHIEDKGPTTGKAWIGYGLYKIDIDSFYFYLDYLDSDYPFIYQPDIKITYEYRPTPHKNIIKIFAMFNSSNQITIENNGEVINVSKDLFLNQEIQATNFHIQGEVPLNDLIDDHLFTNVIVDGNNTITVGKTLTINRNDYPDPSKLDEIGMRFNSSTSLTINGTLNAIGTSTGRITFDRSGTTGTWGSITFDGSTASGSILNNVNIKYASDVKCLNGANVTIQNSLIDHCTQGIYVYNSQPQILNNQIKEPVQNGIYCDALGKSPLILNNLITKASSNPTFRNYQGIWLVNHTNGYIAHNDIN